MSTSFHDRRRDFREVAGNENGTVTVDGQLFPLVNWSRSGLLVSRWELPVSPGKELAASIRIKTDYGILGFDAHLKVVRYSADARSLAAMFVNLKPDVQGVIERHFDPALRLRAQLTGAIYSSSEIQREDAGLPYVAPDPTPEPMRNFRSFSADQLAAVADCLHAVKISFARRFHPDTEPTDEIRALKTIVFREFWEIIGQMEQAVAARRDEFKPEGARSKEI